jgi:hypothetical protein
MSDVRNIMEAIHSLQPDTQVHVRTLDDITWIEGDEIPKAAIETEIIRLQAEYDAQEYARNRASEYPSNGDQWDMIYKDNKNSTTTHADAVEAVKTKWPKDNSGPV